MARCERVPTYDDNYDWVVVWCCDNRDCEYHRRVENRD